MADVEEAGMDANSPTEPPEVKSRNIVLFWTAQASQLIGDCFDRAKPMLDQDYLGLPPLTRFVVAQLFIACHLSSESVLLLLREDKEWDADLIGRSVMEGSLKLTYMLRGTREEVSLKVDEYWNILPLFASIRDGEYAQRFLDQVPKPIAPEWQPIQRMLVSPKEVEQTRAEYSRADRRLLEERWSVTGICRAFAASAEPSLRGFVGLAYNYAMSSHHLHKDADGVGMVWERCGREPDRQLAVKMGHAARVVSDVCTFGKLRLWEVLRACGEPLDSIREIETRYANLFSALQGAREHFIRVEYDDGS
jgi:hypothetical protein